METKDIKFGFFGDTMIGGEFVSHVELHSLDMMYPFKSVEEMLGKIDICVMNLEGPVADGTNLRPGVTSIISNHHALIEHLENRDGVVLNLANNHIMDYGEEGLSGTIQILKDKNIKYFGAGLNITEADQELIIDRKGKKIAFLGSTTDENHVGSVIAGPDTAGCSCYRDDKKLIERIKKLRNKAEIICVSLHWGKEYYSYPSTDQMDLAHRLVDAGADYVYGHHPHVAQGIEQYKDSLIMYSTGNYFFSPYRSTTGRIELQKEITLQFLVVTAISDGKRSLLEKTIVGKRNKEYLLVPYKDKNMINNIVTSLSLPLTNKQYDQFYMSYQKRRVDELKVESIKDAFIKLKNTPIKKLINSITIDDLLRNLKRVREIIKIKFNANEK